MSNNQNFNEFYYEKRTTMYNKSFVEFKFIDDHDTVLVCGLNVCEIHSKNTILHLTLKNASSVNEKYNIEWL